MSRVTALDNRFGGFSDVFTTFGDVLLVLAYTLVVGASVATGVVAGPLRVVLAAPLLAFLPGYALVSVLFPARNPREATVTRHARSAQRPRGVRWFERLCLSVGATVALVPLVALLLSALGVPFDTTPIVLALLVLTGGGVLLGTVRRLQLPESERFALPVDRWYGELRAGTVDADRGVDAVLNVVLALLVVASLSALAFGLAAPQSGESFTEAALLGEDGGELVAGNYSTELTPGETTDLTLTVENQEGDRTNYTAVAVLERVQTDNGSVRVLERSEVDRVSLTVPDGETQAETLAVNPEMLGDDLRLNVLVYEGDPPATVSPDNADTHLFLWVDVTESSADAGAVIAPPPAVGGGS